MTRDSWHLYVLRCADDSLYCGITTDVERRVRAHNGGIPGGAKYTRSRRPVVLIYWSLVGIKSEALRAEAEFKSMRRDKKLERLEEWRATQKA